MSEITVNDNTTGKAKLNEISSTILFPRADDPLKCFCYNVGFLSKKQKNSLGPSCTQPDGICIIFFISMHIPSDWVQFGPIEFFCFLDKKKPALKLLRIRVVSIVEILLMYILYIYLYIFHAWFKKKVLVNCHLFIVNIQKLWKVWHTQNRSEYGTTVEKIIQILA